MKLTIHCLGWKIVLIFAFSFITGASISKAQQPEILVQDQGAIIQAPQPNPAQTTTSAESAASQLNRIAGGTNFIAGEDVEHARTIKEALDAQPGVISRTFEGGQKLINIRGSGIQSIPMIRGIYLLQDGLPMNRADGSFLISVVEPRIAQHIEILRGGNALSVGSTTLGGSINFITHTGYDAPLAQTSIEVGSFNYFGMQASSGMVVDETDYYASFIKNSDDGYRANSHQSLDHLQLNLGHKISENASTRIMFTAVQNDFEVAGPLSKITAENHPRDTSTGPPTFAGPNIMQDIPMRQIDFYRLADKTVLGWDNEKITSSIYYFHLDDRIRRTRARGIAHYNSNDFGGELSYTNENEIGGNANTFQTSFIPAFDWTQLSQYQNLNGATGNLFGHHDLFASSFVGLAENNFKITPNFSFIASTQFSYAYREIDEKICNLTSTGSKTLDYFGWNPKIGFTYDFNEKQQVFWNASRSFEPPVYDDIINTGGAPNPNAHPTRMNILDLSAQTATTLEIGTRGKEEFFSWDATFYNSWVEDELLTFQDELGNVVTQNVNSTTIHQGIETGFSIELCSDMIEQKDTLTLRPVYNWSNFYFDDHFRYGTNQIAGIPEHLVNVSLTYQHPSGFYIAPNVEWMITKTPVDHSHSQFQDPYAIMGMRGGYRTEHGLSIFAEAKNLLDDRYVASVMPRDRVASATLTSFMPGEGFSIRGGIEYKW